MYGDAWQWWGRAQGHFPTGHIPAVGAIAVWAPFTGGASDAGHVAYVAGVSPDEKTITVDEANYGEPLHVEYGRQISASTVEGFIYGGPAGDGRTTGATGGGPGGRGTVAGAMFGPTLAVWPNAPGQQDVFWKGYGSNGLWEATWNNGWHGPSPVPGPDNLASSPTAVINPARGEEDIFWEGTDSQLWEIYWATANGNWNGPGQVGMGPLGSAPSVAVWPNAPGQQDVFWKGYGNNGLWEATWNNGWHGPYEVPGPNNVASAPTAVINPARGEEDVFWKGTDGQLWEIYWATSNGSWNGPAPVGMGPLG